MQGLICQRTLAQTSSRCTRHAAFHHVLLLLLHASLTCNKSTQHGSVRKITNIRTPKAATNSTLAGKEATQGSTQYRYLLFLNCVHRTVKLNSDVAQQVAHAHVERRVAVLEHVCKQARKNTPRRAISRARGVQGSSTAKLG
jgi:hypothetical protein